MSNIILKNWDAEGQYDFGFGIGHYFNNKKMISKDGETIVKEVNPMKRVRVYEDILAFMVETAKKYGGGFPFFVVDDCSPYQPEPNRTVDIIGDQPLLYVHLPKNIGCGGKENMLQHVLGKRCKYVLRFDDDMQLDKLPLNSLRKAFIKYKDAWAITSCITYFARLAASQLPDDQRYFAGSNIADFVAFRSSVFEKVGYSDPKCTRNSDGDLRLRIAAVTDMKCYVDKKLTGKAAPSGSGNTYETAVKAARYVETTRPFIRVSYPKSGNPRFALNKKKKETAKGFFIPPLPFAVKLADAVWK